MPIENLEAFNSAIDKFGLNLTAKDFIQFHKRIVFEAVKRITLRTRVKTGRARGAWLTTIGETTEDVPAGDEDPPNVDDVVQKSVAALRGLGFGEVVYIQNNVKYIIFLEEGTDRTPPDGMVAITLEELRDFVER